ncbi:MAG: S-layer homology domain-containing protein [Acidimicrobiia bacterium]
MSGWNRHRRGPTLAVAVVSILAFGALSAAADSIADEERFVDLINAERRAAGSGPLVVVPALVDGARGQAERMAEEGRIFHNQNLGDITDGWYLLGENVGKGGNIDSLHDAFMNSPSHRDNLLNPVYDAVGVGVVWAEGVPYVAEVFMDSIEPLQYLFTPPFADDDGSIHEADIVSLFELGITNGCAAERYCPDRPVTRAEMATLMVRAFDLSGGSDDVFSDADGSEHQSAIEILADNGITKGCAPGRFCPSRAVTRGEMATFLTRALNLDNAGSAGFEDIGSTEHAAAINALAAAGITKGCSPVGFCPNAEVTRAQMASFLIRALG